MKNTKLREHYKQFTYRFSKMRKNIDPWMNQKPLHLTDAEHKTLQECFKSLHEIEAKFDEVFQRKLGQELAMELTQQVLS